MSSTQAVQRLEMEAYTAVLRALMVSPMDWEKEKIMTELRTHLHISNDEHLAVLRKVSEDPELNRLKQDLASERERMVHTGYAQQMQMGNPYAPEGRRLEKRTKKQRMVDGSAAFVGSGGLAGSGGYGGPQHRGPGRPPAAHKLGGAAGTPLAGTPSGGMAMGRGPGRPPARLDSGDFSASGGRGMKRKNSKSFGGQAGEQPVSEYIGRQVWRNWPDEDPEWAMGIVTDYNATTDTHTIVYDMNTPKESWEDFCFATAHGSSYSWPDGKPVDPVALMQNIPMHSARGSVPFKRGRKRVAARRGSGVPAVPPVAARPDAFAGPAAAGARVPAGTPYDEADFVARLSGGDHGELERMRGELQAAVAALRGALAELDSRDREELVHASPRSTLAMQLEDWKFRRDLVLRDMAALPVGA